MRANRCDVVLVRLIHGSQLCGDFQLAQRANQIALLRESTAQATVPFGVGGLQGGTLPNERDRRC